MPATTVSPALKQLRKRFDYHRSIGKRAVFPDHLKWQTVALLANHSAAEIQTALQISSATWARWKQKALNEDVNTLESGEKVINKDVGTFITLPASKPDVSEYFPLTVSLGGVNKNDKITLQSDITLQQWQAVLAQVTKALLP